jgi:AcrR family transcriptional regulator
MTLRERQKEQGRELIRAAAQELFLQGGYTGTPVTAVAEKAGVAEKTVYNLFQTKSRLLMDVFRSRVLGGSDDPLELDHERIRSLDDPAEMIALFCEANEKVASRAVPLLRVVLEAAAVDKEVAALVAAQEEFRYQHQAYLLHALRRHGHLRTDHPFEELQRGLWLAVAPELSIKAIDAGWDLKRLTEWNKQVLRALLVRDRPVANMHAAVDR